jgi:hypothetical protein
MFGKRSQLASSARGLYGTDAMADSVNLADPDVEPTDEQLAELMKRAFADVRAKHEAALSRLHAEIAVARTEVLARLEAREKARRGSK